MKAVLTRVNNASVAVDEKVCGRIGRGFLILLGIGTQDGPEQCLKLADKICTLRIFEDENGKMNRSLSDVEGEILVVSQFTLYGNCKKGRRPDFFGAARPETAVPLYEQFIERVRGYGFNVQTGKFGAYMQVNSENDGPVTIILDTNEL